VVYYQYFRFFSVVPLCYCYFCHCRGVWWQLSPPLCPAFLCLNVAIGFFWIFLNCCLQSILAATAVGCSLHAPLLASLWVLLPDTAGWLFPCGISFLVMPLLEQGTCRIYGAMMVMCLACAPLPATSATIWLLFHFLFLLLPLFWLLTAQNLILMPLPLHCSWRQPCWENCDVPLPVACTSPSLPLHHDPCCLRLRIAILVLAAAVAMTVALAMLLVGVAVTVQSPSSSPSPSQSHLHLYLRRLIVAFMSLFHCCCLLCYCHHHLRCGMLVALNNFSNLCFCDRR